MTEPSGPALVLYNPRAGSARDDEPARIERALGDCELVEVGEQLDLGARVRAAVARGARAVVAVGGDGTVSSVATELVGSATRLGIIPRGTANSVAVALGIPDDLDEACAVIAGGRARTVDSALAAGRNMLLMATIGVHARAVTDASAAAKQNLGMLAYLSKGVELMFGAEPFAIELHIDEQTPPLRASVHALTIANIAPPRTVVAQGPPEVLPDDGLLDVTLIAFDGLLDALMTTVHLYRQSREGLPAERDNVGFLRAHSVAVRAEPEQRVMIDGELAGSTPFEVRCRPATLAVLAPDPNRAPP